jgi:hypothetical protein
MTEREIFLDALDREDGGERAAYLDAACARRPALRRRVEALLKAYAGAGDFLERPPPGAGGGHSGRARM